MKLINAAKAGRVLPNGIGIEPGLSIDIPDADWETMKDHPVVKGWVDAGDLIVPKAEKPAETGKK